LRELIYSYEEESGAMIDILALTITVGQHISILGANGFGKSTLLKVLSGLHRPTSSRVLIDGVDMGKPRRAIEYLSHEVRLFASTLRKTLNLTSLERGDEQRLASHDSSAPVERLPVCVIQ